jgi:peptide/nickel transport system substrate-binding protein
MRRFPPFAVTLLLLGVASACAGPAQIQTGQASEAAPAAPAQDTPTKEQIIVRLWDNPQGFDPATLFRIETENVAFNIYSGLTTYDPVNGDIVPDLAESWEVEDATKWTFRLRRGVQWHAGYGELSASDVVYSYNRVLDPATGSPYRNAFANVEEVTALDDYTVNIILRSPDANFLHQVASYHQGQVVKKEAVEKFGGQYQMNPVGTGPFMLERFTPNSEIVLARHDGYFHGPANLKKVIYRIIKDDSTAEVALKNREVDIAGRLSQDEIVERLQKDSRFTLYKLEGYAISLLMLNTEFEPFSKVEVRRAMAHAVDWDGILQATAPLTASKAPGIVPRWMSVFADGAPTYTYDPDRARSLLRSAGYPDGFAVKYTRSAAGGTSEADLLLKDYLGKVGINMDFELVETTVYNQKRNRGDFQMSGRLLPAVNPDTILFSYLHPSNVAPNGLNGARYVNDRVTGLIEGARAEGDAARRSQMYHEAQRLVMEDVPYLPRSQNNTYWPAWQGVKGVAINKLANVNFWPVTVQAE